MRTDSLERVRRVLEQAPYPVTVNHIVRVTKLSSPTVQLALAELGATKHKDAWPITWTKAQDTSNIPNLGTTEDQIRLDVIRDQDLIDRWNTRKMVFANKLTALTVNPDTNPEELAAQFIEGAETLASIAYQLVQVKDDPDWYTQLSQGADDE